MGTRRAIVIRGTIPDIQRRTDVIVDLDRDDYAKASDAHISWQTVQVSGILSRSGTGWRLSKVADFKGIP